MNRLPETLLKKWEALMHSILKKACFKAFWKNDPSSITSSTFNTDFPSLQAHRFKLFVGCHKASRMCSRRVITFSGCAWFINAFIRRLQCATLSKKIWPETTKLAFYRSKLHFQNVTSDGIRYNMTQGRF